MLYPNELIPNSTEMFSVDGTNIVIPKTIVKFKKWRGKPIENTFGNKPLLDFEGSPMFAELAIMKTFTKDGWESRWIEPYGRPKLSPFYLEEWTDSALKDQVDQPIENKEIQELLKRIAEKNNSKFGGCWDVLAWKDEHLIFAESKRSKKDFIQSTQNQWLNAAFKVGLRRENFLMVEWTAT
ncbi:hypothetical protein [Halocola ammonii]